MGSVRVEGCSGEPVRVVCYTEGIYDVFNVRRKNCLDFYISIKGNNSRSKREVLHW